MDSRTRDETRVNNLSSPNEVSGPHAEPMDNSNNDSGAKDLVNKNTASDEQKKEAKLTALKKVKSTVDAMDKKFQVLPFDENEDAVESEKKYTQKQLMSLNNIELLKL